MRSFKATQRFTHESDLGFVPGLVEHPTHQLETQEHEVGIHHIGFTVITNFLNVW